MGETIENGKWKMESGQPVEAVRAVRMVRCCPWFLAAWEERIGRGNEKQYARRLSKMYRTGVQNGKREKSEDRSQETEWGRIQ